LSCGQNATAYRCAPGGTGQGACGRLLRRHMTDKFV
jgi:hypothetical protein